MRSELTSAYIPLIERMIKSLGVGKRPYFHGGIAEGEALNDYEDHVHEGSGESAKKKVVTLLNSRLHGKDVARLIARPLGKDQGGNTGWAVGTKR